MKPEVYEFAAGLAAFAFVMFALWFLMAALS